MALISKILRIYVCSTRNTVTIPQGFILATGNLMNSSEYTVSTALCVWSRKKANTIFNLTTLLSLLQHQLRDSIYSKCAPPQTTLIFFSSPQN